ncbi:hypothetical protein [uncultured Brevundimonas sp.]
MTPTRHRHYLDSLHQDFERHGQPPAA